MGKLVREPRAVSSAGGRKHVTDNEVGSKWQRAPNAKLAGLDPFRKSKVLTSTAAWTSTSFELKIETQLNHFLDL